VAIVTLPGQLAALLRDGEIATKKGPIFQTAILAGVMGAKKTSELIPLCHPLPLDDCQIEIVPDETRGVIAIHCRVETEAKTGVEMEAMTGASVAALTIYDMAKAVSHGIVIQEVRLLEKTGGKRAYRAP
jgi:cyclic pyranopterin monophosphate synthase